MIYSPLIVAFDKSKEDVPTMVVGYQQDDKLCMVNELTGQEAKILYFALMGYITLSVKEVADNGCEA